MDRREGEVGAPSVLSWETVVEGDEPAPAGAAATPASLAAKPSAPNDKAPGLSIPPLSLDPLPSAQHPPTDAADEPSAPVLGGLHLGLPPLGLETIEQRPTPEPAAEGAPDLTITPFDMPEFSLGSALDLPVREPGGSLSSAPAPAPTPAPEPVAAPMPDIAPPAVEVAPLITEPVTEPVTAPVPTQITAPVTEPMPVQSAPAEVAIAPPAPEAPAVVEAAPAPAPVAETIAPAPVETVAPAPAVAAELPADPVPVDAMPTTAVADLGAVQAAAVAAPAAISLPQHQPNQVAAVAPALVPVPAKQPAAARKQQKQKQKKQKQKSGGSGLALFFTLLVLVALIVAAIVFGRPYLFPDQWDDDSRPYGEAIEAARGTEFKVPVSVLRTASAAFEVTMADQLLGEWESELPTWRSLGLADGAMDAPLLRTLVEGWSYAFYSPQDGLVYSDASLSPAAVDGAIAEGVAAAAYDEETGWSTRLDDSLLDFSAVTRGQVIATSRTSAAVTSFGPAIAPERQIAVAAFLPPVLEYRVNAPSVFAELVPESNVVIDPVVATNQLAPSSEPTVAEGDTVVAVRPQVDRSFWYLVFAAYTDAPTAYGASNALVQSTLATVDRAGQTCSYGTFSGSDVDGTQRISNVLAQWVANSPAEFGAGVTVLEDGTLQLVSCDPGIGFESRARFGVARELTRWRAVELAAVANVDPITGTNVQRQAEVDRVRASGAGIELMGLPFDTDAATTAQLAGAAATPVPQPGAVSD